MIYLLTNERTPMKEQMLQIIYSAAESNQIGYADLKDQETGEIVPMLIGLEVDAEGKLKGASPIARILTMEEATKTYLLPDGAGGYLDINE